jgi:glycosyltransferase involved in cell wall biosynthesis
VKVAFAAPLPFSLAFGGLEIQVLRTAEALRAQGIVVDLLDPWKMEFDADLLHCFGSEYQLGELVTRAKRRGIPVVVSAVFMLRRPALFYRLWRYIDRFVPMKTSYGVRGEIVRGADAVIVLTAREAAALELFWGVRRAKLYVIPNGVEERFFAASPTEFETAYGLRKFVLCVASIEPRKNQWRLLRALERVDLPVVLIGAERAGDDRYVREVERLVARRKATLWIRGLPHDSPLLASAYAAAVVHVLPSLAEVQPLAALEAAAAGANVVMSDLPCHRDTFGVNAWYCDPRSEESIRRAVLAAYRAPRGARRAGHPWVLSWNEVAMRLIDVYRGVLATGSVAGAKPSLAHF